MPKKVKGKKKGQRSNAKNKSKVIKGQMSKKGQMPKIGQM
jgi:hypothetical protein